MHNAAIGLALIIGIPVGLFVLIEVQWSELARSLRALLTSGERDA
jgi:hypothetical protein